MLGSHWCAPTKRTSSGPSTASTGRVTGHRWSCTVRAAYAAHAEPSCPAGSAFFTARDMVCSPANNITLSQSKLLKLPAWLCEASSWLTVCVLIMALTSREAVPCRAVPATL